MSVYEKLLNVQAEIRAPKTNYNSFAKFNYRSLEDITEAMKPVLKKYGATVILNDSVEVVEGWHYIKCTATFYDCETGESVSNTAYARESNEKKGMDDAQVSGMASSYCRKYCLNGLLLLDDVKDSDTDEAHIEKEARAEAANKKKNKAESLPQKEQTILKELVAKAGLELASTFPNGIEYMTAEQYREACIKLNGLIEKKKAKA